MEKCLSIVLVLLMVLGVPASAFTEVTAQSETENAGKEYQIEAKLDLFENMLETGKIQYEGTITATVKTEKTELPLVNNPSGLTEEELFKNYFEGTYLYITYLQAVCDATNRFISYVKPNMSSNDFTLSPYLSSSSEKSYEIIKIRDKLNKYSTSFRFIFDKPSIEYTEDELEMVYNYLYKGEYYENIKTMKVMQDMASITLTLRAFTEEYNNINVPIKYSYVDKKIKMLLSDIECYLLLAEEYILLQEEDPKNVTYISNSEIKNMTETEQNNYLQQLEEHYMQVIEEKHQLPDGHYWLFLEGKYQLPDDYVRPMFADENYFLEDELLKLKVIYDLL